MAALAAHVIAPGRQRFLQDNGSNRMRLLAVRLPPLSPAATSVSRRFARSPFTHASLFSSEDISESGGGGGSEVGV